MISPESNVQEFHEYTDGDPKYSVEEKDVTDLRIRLIDEEVREFKEAVESGDRKAILKEAADIVYVVVGSCVTWDMRFDEAFSRVHESNMTKIPEDGIIRRRPDGKILKPDTYKAPDLEDLV